MLDAVALDALCREEADKRLAAVISSSPWERTLHASHRDVELLVPSHATDSHGITIRLTPESAGWTYVGFDVYRPRSVHSARSVRETCVDRPVRRPKHPSLRRRKPDRARPRDRLRRRPVASNVPPGVRVVGDSTPRSPSAPHRDERRRCYGCSSVHATRRGRRCRCARSPILMEDEAADSLLRSPRYQRRPALVELPAAQARRRRPPRDTCSRYLLPPVPRPRLRLPARYTRTSSSTGARGLRRRRRARPRCYHPSPP